MRYLLLWIILLAVLSPLLGHTQMNGRYTEHKRKGILIGEGPQKPKAPKEGQWYYNSKFVGEVHVFVGGKWHHLPLAYGTLPTPDGNLMRIKNSVMYAFATPQGRMVIERGSNISRVGRLLVGQDDGHGFALLDDRDTLAYLHTTGKCLCLTAVEIDGKSFFVLPKYYPKVPKVDSIVQCNWGMIDTDGNWVIEPVYDDYFTFKEGVAVVKRYGKSFKINVKGETVP